MEPSIYTRIMNGELPCHKVYEDQYSFAFMDIHPIQTGMVLAVSKRQTTDFTELTEEEFTGLMLGVKKIADKLKMLFPDKERIAVMLEGLDVPHTHVKIFPFNTSAEYRHVPDASIEPDHVALEKLAEQIRITQ